MLNNLKQAFCENSEIERRDRRQWWLLLLQFGAYIDHTSILIKTQHYYHRHYHHHRRRRLPSSRSDSDNCVAIHSYIWYFVSRSAVSGLTFTVLGRLTERECIPLKIRTWALICSVLGATVEQEHCLYTLDLMKGKHVHLLLD